jgi:hypothetical protein
MPATESAAALKANKVSVMSDMQRIVRLAAEPRAVGDSTKAAIARASRRLQLSYRRCYDFWYATSSASVRAVEADRLRTEELRLLASRRIRLNHELDLIEAQLNAREGRANAQVAMASVGTPLPAGAGGLDANGENGEQRPREGSRDLQGTALVEAGGERGAEGMIDAKPVEAA